MKNHVSRSITALFCFFCLIACGLIQPQAQREIVVTLNSIKFKGLDMKLYDTADSALIFNAYVNVSYRPVVYIGDVPDGIYRLFIESSDHPGYGVVDTTFKYEEEIKLMLNVPE